MCFFVLSSSQSILMMYDSVPFPCPLFVLLCYFGLFVTELSNTIQYSLCLSYFLSYVNMIYSTYIPVVLIPVSAVCVWLLFLHLFLSFCFFFSIMNVFCFWL